MLEIKLNLPFAENNGNLPEKSAIPFSPFREKGIGSYCSLSSLSLWLYSERIFFLYWVGDMPQRFLNI